MGEQPSSADTPLWEVVELDQFHTPEQTQASQWRRSLRSASKWLVGKSAAEQQVKEESELRALPEVRLAHLVPPIDWSFAAKALAQQLESCEAPVIFFITPPHSGHTSVVRQWAEEHHVACLPPPTLNELAKGGTEWVERCINQQKWAVPALERHFLRHTQGIQGIREFLERALSGRLGQGVIGCDSWAYAYLQQVIGIDGAPVFTLQSMEGEQLSRYFAAMATHEGQPPGVYSTRTGKQVLSDSASKQNGKAPNKELQRLAAHCRGHIGLAWHYWRERLREPKAEDEEALWLVDALAEAELSADTGDIATLVLHALLLHGGLDDHALGDVLPFSHHEALNARLALQRKGIILSCEGRWQITPLSYASVRQLLASRNYLVDPL
ncbi:MULTISPECIES: hypothetical protein [Halomonadaceae]|uniref:Uncharacterized protein n=1 Tax=Vreelandella glaciei TaxID=186761 RepID=A0A7Z0LUH5_9GAMM|nr:MULTISPECIES: hypothetical protein [Halomonas]NYS78834.1 hypothetical protein [Halomonas glaciei]|tara:strand:+ start:77 stop:1225 length:1149 start_codon:yes stop_codon:yes gene_type:complete